MRRFRDGMSIGWATAALCVGLVGAGCGSDDSGGGAGGSAGSSGSSGAGGAGAASGAGGGSGGGQAGSGGGAGAGGSSGAAGFASNTPGAQVTQDAQGAAEGLVVTSSRLVDEPSGNEYYQQWTGLMRNQGSQLICFPQVEAQFSGSGGTPIASHMTFASAPPYKVGSSSLTTPCLAPGEIGGFYANGFAPTPLDLNAITSITFTFDALALSGGEVPHPSAPTVSGLTLVESFGAGSGYWAATGSLAATATIYNIAVEVFPVWADGLVPDRLSDVHLDTLFSASSWAFETSTYEGEMATGALHAYVDFIEGMAQISPPVAPDSAAQSKLEAKRRLKAHQRVLAERFMSRR